MTSAKTLLDQLNRIPETRAGRRPSAQEVLVDIALLDARTRIATLVSLEDLRRDLDERHAR